MDLNNGRGGVGNITGGREGRPYSRHHIGLHYFKNPNLMYEKFIVFPMLWITHNVFNDFLVG